MRIGIGVPNHLGVEEVHPIVDLIEQAEAFGFASAWTAEHMLNIGYVADRIGERPYYHPLTILTYAAARTSVIELGTGVIVPSFYHPVNLAKYVSTLDQLSRGRVILGFAAGQLVDEFEAMGLRYDERAAVTDESIAVMNALWGSTKASHHGERWNFDDILQTPRPYRSPRPRLWSGGAGRPSRRRAATTCDGWLAVAIPVEEFRVGVREIRVKATAVGRDAHSIRMAMSINVDMKSAGSRVADPGVVVANYNASIVADGWTNASNDSATLVALLTAYKDAGATDVVLTPETNRVDEIQRTLGRWANEVLPEFHR